MGPRGYRRALAATLLAGALAAACGAGAPPHLEVTSGPQPGARGAVDVPERENLPEAARAGTPEWTGAGATVAARFTLRNTGGRDLLLHGLLPDCGCRLASALPDALAPGEETALTLICRAPYAGGEIVRENRLLSSDPVRPEESLRVRIPVVRAAAEPAALYFGYVPVGGSATRDLVVDDGAGRVGNRGPAGRAGDRGDPGGGSARAAAEGPESVPVADDAAIRVEPLPPRADGKRAYQVRFAPRTTGALRTTLHLGPGLGGVAASGVGFRTVLVFPPEVSLPNETTAGGPPVIVLRTVDDAPLEITRVEFPAGLVGELKTVTPGHEYRLALRVSGRLSRSADAIRLHTSAPDDPVVAIPVRHAQALEATIPTAPTATP